MSAEAQILSIHDLQEADRIVALLTAEHGKVRGVARGSKRKFSRFAGPLHPLAKVQASWSEKPTSELVRFSGLDLIRPAEGLQRELEEILYAAYLAHHTETFAQEKDAAPDLYRLLDRSVSALLAGCDREAVVRYFELWILRLSGILSEPTSCSVCGSSLADGAAPAREGLACRNCCGSNEVAGRQAVGFIALSRQRSPEGLAELEWPASVLAEVERLCATIRRRFLGVELRSYEILKDVLQESPDPRRR